MYYRSECGQIYYNFLQDVVILTEKKKKIYIQILSKIVNLYINIGILKFKHGVSRGVCISISICLLPKLENAFFMWIHYVNYYQKWNFQNFFVISHKNDLFLL